MFCLPEESLFLELASKMIPRWNILTWVAGQKINILD